jgi:hypothetical protein
MARYGTGKLRKVGLIAGSVIGAGGRGLSGPADRAVAVSIALGGHQDRRC